MTMNSTLRVTVTRRLPQDIETRLGELFDVVLNSDDVIMDSDRLCAALQSSDVLLAAVGDRLSSDTLSQAGDRCKLIASFGTGVDHIDLESAAANGLKVTNTPGVLTEDTADMAMLLILAAARRMMVGGRLLQSGDWRGWSPTSLLGQRIGSKKLGIIGMGRIGQALARRALAFGMTIHYHNRRRVDPAIEQQLHATWWQSLDQMLARIDIVSVNCPHTPATYHLLSERRLKLLSSHVVIVNTARGEIIDERALARMLVRGEIAGAGLDVFEREPKVPPALIELANVVALPHMGSATLESRLDMGYSVIENILAYSRGETPPNLVTAS